MARTGRPPKAIDQKAFESLCGMMCTEEEIAGFFDCTIDTINNWCKKTYNCTFLEVYKKKSSTGKISLRRAQFKLAEKNAAMAIFLGKNYLGQTDKTEIEDNAALEKLDELLKNVHENAIQSEAE